MLKRHDYQREAEMILQHAVRYSGNKVFWGEFPWLHYDPFVRFIYDTSKQ